MGNVLKGYRYRIVDNRSFELPLPIKYVLLKEDNEIAEYEILKDESVNCRIITKYKENMITPIYRPLNIADIYYFFSCRVFQDKTPFTGTELKLLGLERYNVYDIIRKTRGITPYDNYWLRFDGDECSYETAKKEWDDAMSQIDAKPETAVGTAGDIPHGDADINEILNQQKVDVASKLSEAAATARESEPKSVSGQEPASDMSVSNTMSESEIEALLMKSGLSDLSESESEESESSGGTLNQDDIEKMLAAATASVEDTVTEVSGETVDEVKSSGGKMGQDEIEKMLAAATASVEDTVTETVEENKAETVENAVTAEEKPAGIKVDQDEIEKMLSEVNAAVEEAVTGAADTSETFAGDTVSADSQIGQDDIEKMLEAAAAAEAAVDTSETLAGDTVPVDSQTGQDDIEKMLEAAASAEESASETAADTAETLVENTVSSDNKIDEGEIEKMLAAASEAVQEPIISEPEQPVLDTLSGNTEEEAKPAETPAFVSDTEPKPAGGKMSQADIEALLNGMEDDVK